MKDCDLMALRPDSFVARVAPVRDFSPRPLAFHAARCRREKSLPFFRGMASSVCSYPLVAHLAPRVPAIHTAVPTVETAAAAFGANTPFRHLEALFTQPNLSAEFLGIATAEATDD